jgi:hypothetical protein
MNNIRVNNIRVAACRNPGWQSIDLYIRDGAGEQNYAAELHFNPILAGEGSDPTIRLTDEQAQVLLDQLVACGFRPTEFGTAGQLEATEDHLEDMRVLAFHALGIVRPT